MEKRRGSLRALAAEVPRIVAPVLGKRGFAEAQLVSEWPAIIGAALAEMTAPDRLSFVRGERRNGTLHLRVAPGCALEIQHRTPVILERINAFFGYGAVARLVLIQGPLPRSAASAAPPLRPLAAPERDRLERSLEAVAQPGLRAALRRLGEAVIGTGKG